MPLDLAVRRVFHGMDDFSGIWHRATFGPCPEAGIACGNPFAKRALSTQWNPAGAGPRCGPAEAATGHNMAGNNEVDYGPTLADLAAFASDRLFGRDAPSGRIYNKNQRGASPAFNPVTF